jgi:hypothetical protein
LRFHERRSQRRLRGPKSFVNLFSVAISFLGQMLRKMKAYKFFIRELSLVMVSKLGLRDPRSLKSL